MKDNQRLRKENETYKTLTIVFENELKNTMKKSGLTPQKNKITRHVKTYSDYGVPTNSIINELSGYNNAFSLEEKYDTINSEVKNTTARNKATNKYTTKNIIEKKEEKIKNAILKYEQNREKQKDKRNEIIEKTKANKMKGKKWKE